MVDTLITEKKFVYKFLYKELFLIEISHIFNLPLVLFTLFILSNLRSIHTNGKFSRLGPLMNG